MNCLDGGLPGSADSRKEKQTFQEARHTTDLRPQYATDGNALEMSARSPPVSLPKGFGNIPVDISDKVPTVLSGIKRLGTARFDRRSICNAPPYSSGPQVERNTQFQPNIDQRIVMNASVCLACGDFTSFALTPGASDIV